MKKQLLLFLFIQTLAFSSFAQFKSIYVDSRVSGANLTFSLYQKQTDGSYLEVKTGTSTYTYTFDSLSSGMYRVHINIDYAKYIPTWHPLKALWEDATDIDLTTADSVGINEGLLPNPSFFGPASIDGEMIEGLFKTQGDPLKNVRVLIINASNQLVKMVNTNDSGKFIADHLPLGTYSIKTDIMNVVNVNAPEVTLDSSNLVSTVSLTVNKGGTVHTGLSEINTSTNDVQFFPNPSNGIFHISSSSPGIQYCIYTAEGKVIQQDFMDTYVGTINIQGQKPGVYYITTQNNNRTVTKKVILVP
jgi:hypothetical protein